jgi:phosphate transport system permease protein
VAVARPTLETGGPAPPARSLGVHRTRTRHRLLADRLAARLVVGGGLVIIAAILAILVVIASEVYPLFRAPRATLLDRAGAEAAGSLVPAPGVALGVDEYRTIAYLFHEHGVLAFLGLAGPAARVPPPVPIPGLDGARITAVAAAAGSQRLLGTADGRVVPVEVAFQVSFADGARTVTPAPSFGEPALLDPDGRRPIRALAFAPAAESPVTVAQVGPTELVLETVIERKALIGPGTRRAVRRTLAVPLEGAITGLALDGRGDELFVGSSRGQVLRYDLRDRATPRVMETVDASTRPGVPVTVLGFLIGDRTLVVGDQAGGVATWQVVPPAGGGERRLVRIHEFPSHAAPVIAVSVSRRDKGFVTADVAGGVHLSYGTSGRTLLTLDGAGSGGIAGLVFAPKADGLVAIGEQGQVRHWQLRNPHPGVTWRTLFGKVWYEGYAEPDHVWQSTGGTDDFEAKLSLTPLVFGTLKGTLYALLFAVPLALLSAVYVSEFMHPTIKGYVKPVVEIMAALPSVVLGFLAGLWLAPVVERVVPGLVLAPLVLPVAVWGALLAWRLVPPRTRGRLRSGAEVVLLVPVVGLGMWLAFALGHLTEVWLLGGSYPTWLSVALGLTYDQRNSLVVGIAMGFAVIPIIFTIAEDSLANVPGHLRAGSLALGATRWQTALRVVLPTASPGIFSAIMIGFGRAVGETMIVLMATGNTPIMEWSVFNGFRALSANIAVELPEAPEGGTLFRVLFLAAFLLFCLTFAVNTVAELVRLKLRARYRYL